MVIEPSTDAWPPIAWQVPEVGAEQSWTWTAKDTSGQTAVFTELRTFVAEEDGLLKFKIGESFEWYQAGFSGFPRRASGSAIFGGLGGTVIGQPEMIFPLRKGKEVHFELALNQTENTGLPTHLKLGPQLKLRGSCVVGDKTNLQVRTNCSFKTDADLEVSVAMTWDEARKKFVKQEYRLVRTGGDQYVVTTLTGEETSQVSEVRTPTSF
jgi:hypothetical protein